MKRKDMLGLDGVSREEITSILDTALTMRQVVRSNNKKTSHLQGKSIVTLFYENSTRTRMSFELASKYMSAAAANISASASSVAKGETLIDTGVTLDQDVYKRQMQALSAQVIRHKRILSDHCVFIVSSICDGYFHDERLSLIHI